MAHPPGMYIPDAAPPDPGVDGSIDLDPQALARLKKALAGAAELLESDRFADVELDDLAFGASPSGRALGAEHRVAHRIIADTITGVVADLWGYREGVELFENGLGAADETAEADLRARQAAVEALATSATSDHAGTHYRDSQRAHLPAVPPAGTDGQDG